MHLLYQKEESFVFQLPQWIIVQDGDEGVVVDEQFKRWETLKEWSTLPHGPCSCQALQFYHFVSCLCVY